MKKGLLFIMVMIPVFVWAQEEELGKITKVETVAVLKYPSKYTLKLKVSLWRRYMNTPFYCVFFASSNPITNVNTIEEMKSIAATTNCGMADKTGVKLSEEEFVYVDVPLDRRMMTIPFYLSGFIVTSSKTTEFMYEVYKNIVTYKHQPISVNLQGVKVVEASESTDKLTKTLTKTMFLNLYGIDANGNQICTSCEGIGCSDCNWRGWKNDALTSAAKMARSSANAKQRTSTNTSTPILNGRHTKTFPNGDKYTGDFVNGMCTGKGTYTWNDGGKYVGDVRYNQMHGKGTLTYANGDKYTGDFYEDRPQGKGIMSYVDGTKYEGDFYYGNLEGNGTLLLTDGDKFKGEFINGKFAKGRYTWAVTGEFYEGEFAYGNSRHGKGIYVWPDGKKYEGDFNNGKITGKGKYIYTDGSVYEGSVHNGMRDGKGIMRFADGLKYEGDFLLDKISGKGKLTNVDGSTYEGEVRGGVPEGSGYMKYADGDRYDGTFRKGKYDGYGTFYFKEGSRYVTGSWSEGKLVNTKEEGTWEAGHDIYFNGEIMPGMKKHPDKK